MKRAGRHATGWFTTIAVGVFPGSPGMSNMYLVSKDKPDALGYEVSV